MDDAALKVYGGLLESTHGNDVWYMFQVALLAGATPGCDASSYSEEALILSHRISGAAAWVSISP